MAEKPTTGTASREELVATLPEASTRLLEWEASWNEIAVECYELWNKVYELTTDKEALLVSHTMQDRIIQTQQQLIEARERGNAGNVGNAWNTGNAALLQGDDETPSKGSPGVMHGS